MASNIQGIKVHHHVKFYQNRSNGLLRYHNFSIFQDGGCLPSWMGLPCFWTSHIAFLVVFTDVQNLVVIHALVSII